MRRVLAVTSYDININLKCTLVYLEFIGTTVMKLR